MKKKLRKRRNNKIVNCEYACIGLNNPKFPENVGSVLRAAGCYGAKFVAVTGQRYNIKSKKKFITDPQKRYKQIPFLRVDNLKRIIPYDCVPIAVDLTNTAKSISNFSHPERAFYIFGAEDQTLGLSITSWCKETIFVPTDGL